MAMTIKDIREKYPQYESKTDTELADAIHDKYYSSLPKEKVYEKLGLLSDEQQPEEEEETTGLTGLATDAIEGLGNALSAGGKFAIRAPGNAMDIASEFKKEPLSYPVHVAQQVLAGLGEGAKGLANIPHAVFEELADKKITPNWLRTGKIPEDLGVEKALGLEASKPGDELLRALPGIYGGGQLIGKGISKAKKIASAPSKETLFKRALEKRVADAAEKAGMSQSELKGLQDALKLDYSNIHGETLGDASPVSLQEKINIAEHKLAQKKQLTEIPEREVGEIPEAPDTKAMLEEHKALIDTAKYDAEKAVGIKGNPGLKAADKMKSSIKNLEKSSGEIYDAVRDYYKGEKIMADNSAEIKAATHELTALQEADELAPGYGSGTPEQKALQQNIDALKSEKVEASDIYSLMRTSQQLANQTRMKRKGTTQLEWERLTKIANNLDSHADKLGKRLEEVGSKDVRAMIKEANKGYRTFKQLSKENPVGKAAMKGNIPNNALIKLAEDHPANDFLKGLVESDPELRKNLLAAYAGDNNVNKLTNPSSLTKKYIESLPEVEEKLNAFKTAVSEYKGKEKQAAKIDKAHDELVKSMKERAKEQQIRQDAIKESAQIEKQIKFKRDALPKIEAKMKTLDANSAEHKALKKQLKDYNNDIADQGGRLKKLGNIILKYKGIQAIGKKFGV